MIATPAATITSADLARRAGALCLWGGLLGAASGIFLAVVPPAVEPSRFSYPLTPTAFAAIQCWFFVQHLGLIAGLIGMRSTGALGRRWHGFAIAMVGMALLTVMELLAISAAGSPIPSPRSELLDAGYGIACTVSGLGLIATGLAVIRVGAWRGWRRWVPLALGIYVFAPLFPAMFGGFVAARLGITGWMLLFAVLGRIVTEHGETEALELAPTVGDRAAAASKR